MIDIIIWTSSQNLQTIVQLETKKVRNTLVRWFLTFL